MDSMFCKISHCENHFRRRTERGYPYSGRILASQARLACDTSGDLESWRFGVDIRSSQLMLLFEHALIAKFSNDDPDDETQEIPP